jgi:transcriptional regulator with XRE-family HTH domain
MPASITLRDLEVNTSRVRQLSRNVKNGGMDFPTRLLRLREAAGLKQEELALRCGWAGQSRVGNYEAGSRKPRFDDVPALAAALGVHPGELFEDLPSVQGTSHAARLNANKVTVTTQALLRFLRRRDPQAVLDLSDPDDAELFAATYEEAIALPSEPSSQDQQFFGARVDSLIEAREAKRNERKRSEPAGGDTGTEVRRKRTGSKA